jgi:hypothetical protein
VSSAWVSPCEEGNRRGLAGLWAALGCKCERGREAGWAAQPQLGHAGVREKEAAGRAGLGFQLSFGPQPEYN